MKSKEYKYSGSIIAVIGVAIIFFAVFIAFELGIKYKILYGVIAVVGFCIGIFGMVRNAIEVSEILREKLNKKSNKSKQPWE